MPLYRVILPAALVCLIWGVMGLTPVWAEEQSAPESEPEPVLPLSAEAPQPAPFVLHPPYAAATPLPLRGHAMYYNPGVMARVLSYRLQRGQVQLCAECVGYAALLRAGDLNRRIWLQWEDGTVDGPFLVVDAADVRHIPALLARNWAVDLDYRSAQRRGMNRPLPVTVHAHPPAPPADASVVLPAVESGQQGWALICSAVELPC